MFIQINPNNGLAIYDQVVRQVKFGIADGVLRKGDLVPSVREMARQLAINPNTVARAYRQLQDEKLLETVRGTGLQVAEAAPRQCRQERRQLIGERIGTVLEEAAQSGLDSDELSALVEREMAKINRRRKS
jgi:GntR family transcriptional regulator